MNYLFFYLYHLLIFSFFFLCCGDLQYLYSFPTRRSSDLSSTLYFDSLTVNAGNGGFLHCIQMDTSECNEENHHYQDRKSGSAGMPRPNSYAVFCLKKKKKIPTHNLNKIM